MNVPLELRAGLTSIDRWVIGLGLAAVCALAWMFMAWQASTMTDGGAMDGMNLAAGWRLADVALIYLMWVVMMAAMMVPATSPIIVTFAAINRRRRQSGSPHVGTAVFLLGYLLAWSLFSVGLRSTLSCHT